MGAQFVILFFMCFSLGIYSVKHGETKSEDYCFWSALIGKFILFWILWWGGFWDVFWN